MTAQYLYTILLLLSTASAFHLYPTVNPDSLAKSFGIDANCLDALNTTVTCDSDLFLWASSVDNYWWSETNVTDLCTLDCKRSAGEWNADVQKRCDGQNIAVYGKLVEVDSVSGRYYDGLNIACLQSSSSSASSNSSSKYNTSSSSSAGWNSSISSPAGWNSSVSNSAGRNSSTSATNNSGTNSTTTTWCLLESQEWIGSDTIEPNCDNNSTNPLCSETTENDRIANLYDNDMLCSDCFLKMYFRRISSPYLPDSYYSDYLISQYQDIIDVCNATMPDLIIRAPPEYENAPPPGPGLPFGTNNATISAGNTTIHGPYPTNATIHGPYPMNSTAVNGTGAINNTCQGQLIQPSHIRTSCNDLSQAYSVTTGDLQAAIGNDDCSLTAPVCVPAACTLKKVTANATCESLASSCSTNTMSVTVVQFLNWNPNINGLCDQPTTGDYVCVSPPSGFYKPLSAPSSNANAADQARVGSDGSGTGVAATNSTGIATNTTTSASASSAAANLSSSAPPSPASTSSPATKASGTPSAPSPTQTGISTQCNKYAQATGGDSCAKFSQTNNITPQDLYAWNAALGAGGADCDKEFWANYYYCVGVSA